MSVDSSWVLLIWHQEKGTVLAWVGIPIFYGTKPFKPNVDSSSSHISGTSSSVWFCYQGRRALLRTSWMMANPDRCFHGCLLYELWSFFCLWASTHAPTSKLEIKFRAHSNLVVIGEQGCGYFLWHHPSSACKIINRLLQCNKKLETELWICKANRKCLTFCMLVSWLMAGGFLSFG